ncbi:MAG TPA: LPS-assembly protein LptD [Noviherbaspirillum sp.]|nr:LPS-assembly protein LptD [Noviherbaspirillum sp.]
MTRFPAFPPTQRLLRILTALVAAASLPTLASAQTTSKRDRTEDKDAPATVSAEQMTGRPDRDLFLERDVEIVRGQTTINADKATYRVAEDEVEASGNIRMRRFGDTYTGDDLKLKIEAQEGYVTHPTYRLELNNAQGDADRIVFEGEDQATVYDGSYSTCEGPDPDWYLKSGRLKLDSAREEGIAYRTLVYFKGVPILGAPAMSFPLSDARKSGFLPPSIGTTNKGGFEVTVPYYWNIAPNRDLTLYPRFYGRRGLQLGADGRYLGETYSGQTKFEVLPSDQQTGTDRYAIASTHTQILAPGWAGGWNLNSASDADYPTDFSNTITAASQRLLLRDMYVSYGRSYWSTVARVSNYQVLQDPLAPIGRPYDRLPQVTFNASRLDVNGFDLNLVSDITHFSHKDSNMERGERFFVNPGIAYPIIRPGYFVTPKLSMHASTYSLANRAPGKEENLTRVLPTASLDSGLVFERDASFFGNEMVQTLEPRLFYVYTPYRDQREYPLFDTGLAALNFAQLFSENRYVGPDRISDANQLTAALISRYVENNGEERMRFAVGQRFDFTEQGKPRVSGLQEESRSDILLSAYGRLTRAVSTEANLQYSQSLRSTSRANYGVRWQPAPMKVFNLQYRLDRVIDPRKILKQLDLSAQWPFAQRWYGVGRVNYSLPDSKVAEALLGVEYKADCWVFRIVSQRTPTATGEATSAIFFQLELNGLTRLGSNPIEALRRNIPGYQLINQPSESSNF